MAETTDIYLLRVLEGGKSMIQVPVSGESSLPGLRRSPFCDVLTWPFLSTTLQGRACYLEPLLVRILTLSGQGPTL